MPEMPEEARSGATALAGCDKYDASAIFPRGHAPHIALAWSGKLMPRLLPRSLFLEAARREQLRAIRSHTKLVLVIVSFDESAKVSSEELLALSKTLQLRVRETDLLGWYGENAIGILLTDAGEQGARECIDRIQSQEALIPLRFELLDCSQTPFFFGKAPMESPLAGDLQLPAIDAEPAMHPQSQLILKRLLDIFGSLFGIVVLSPLMIAAAIAVKTTSRGPALFRQVRLGKDGKPFVFLKFRSMWADADPNVHRQHVAHLIGGEVKDEEDEDKDEDRGERNAWFKIEADPRITPLGRFLRKTSIDELPQFLNVLMGDMSLVGPRPPIPYEVDAYSPWHLRRIFEVKPGITGLWQVEGRGAITFDDMVRLDLQYARHWTVLMDVRILLKTVLVVLQRRGAG